MQRDNANAAIDEDGPMTEIERWALRLVRSVPFGQVTFALRDDAIERATVNITLKPGEKLPAA